MRTCTYSIDRFNLRIQKKVKYFWIYETLKTIVFMFYCKDVKYDMCELKKKNHDKKNKICKEFDDLTFDWSHTLFH